MPRAPADGPLAPERGPDCLPESGAVAHARQILAGKLVLSPHKAAELPHNPTWAEDPFDDRNWEFQYHSLGFVADLFEAWRQTGNADYRDRGLFLLRDWVRDNPPGAGRSAFSWNDHSTASRTHVLACATLVDPEAGWIRRALGTHGATLADPGFYVRHGNHALIQSRGLLAAGCVLGRRDWQRLATSRIATLLGESVDAEGVTNEQSVFYQLYNFRAYRAAAARLEACGVKPPAVFRRLDRMVDLLTHATLPDGTYVTLGDTSHRPARYPAGTTAQFAATRGVKGPVPSTRFATFDAGFVFGRTGWGEERPFDHEIFWSARFGPGRQFHGHADHGAVTLYGYGRRLVDDPGVFTLNNDRWRAFAIGHSAHNVVTVDGATYDASTRARLVRAETSQRHDDVTMRDPGYPAVDIERRAVFSQGLGWLLVDDHARSDRTRTFRQLWHLLPDADPTFDESNVRTRQCGGNVLIAQLRVPDSIRVVKGRRSPVQGWYSTNIVRRKRAPVVEAVTSGRRARYVTLLVPLPRRDSDVQLSEVSVASRAIEFVLSVDGRRERAEISAEQVTINELPEDPAALDRASRPNRATGKVDIRAVWATRDCNLS